VSELQLILIIGGLGCLLVLYFWTRYRDRLPRDLAGRLCTAVRREPRMDSLALPEAEPVEPPPPRREREGEPPPRVPAKIVTLRLMSRDKAGFPGEQLVLALREEGLRHGRYGIFHWSPDDSGDDPVFSVANLVEPGSFDLTRLRTDTFPGISLFMALPGPMEGVAAFDALVGTARKLATTLGGELLDEQGSTLSIQRQRYIREEIIQFQLRHGHHG
jgi:cell division protein ZipA